LAFVLAVLFAINFMNFFDRQIIGAVGEPIKEEFGLTDTQLGLLGTAFILLYAVVGVPLGWLADIGSRTKILAAGVTVWSLLTAASGLAWNFWTLIVARLGVGLGEASCAPTATSLLGDYFPAKQRARAMSLFMFGLPMGLGISFITSGWIARRLDWRTAFYIAAIPGLLLGFLALMIPEPPRGMSEKHSIGGARRPGWSVLLVLQTPTMIWIILSGALHNFNMYALGGFLSPFLQRFHKIDVAQAGLVSGVVYGLGGGLGILLGGWACDRMVRRRISGRLEVGALALLISAPCIFMALQIPQGSILPFSAWMAAGCSLLYVYYTSVYTAIQDIIEPALRGTAMALYFCAMYVIGAFLGPLGTGLLSDYFARRAMAEGMDKAAAAATGLHNAMYVIPVLGIVLVLVLWAASRTVTADYLRLHKWIESTIAADQGEPQLAVDAVAERPQK
jgi:MFS family permease